MHFEQGHVHVLHAGSLCGCLERAYVTVGGGEVRLDVGPGLVYGLVRTPFASGSIVHTRF